MRGSDARQTGKLSSYASPGVFYLNRPRLLETPSWSLCGERRGLKLFLPESRW